MNAADKFETYGENTDFLTTQIITYLGNKRALIDKIEKEIIEIKKDLKKEKCVCADLFSGSGVVSRMLKKHSSLLIANDLEQYSHVVNSCYLSNKDEFDRKKYLELKETIESNLAGSLFSGIIARNYAPEDDGDIKRGERVFYTKENAMRIDTYRKLIDEIVSDENMRKFFLAPLVTEASIHVNTSGVFKGFYKDKNTGIGCFGGAGKNALHRILGQVQMNEPVFSNFSSGVELYREDAVALAEKLKNLDIAYLDPPYNQHPYGSNYFMLNLIVSNKIDAPVSPVSGIVSRWNRSAFNKPYSALSSMRGIVEKLDSKYAVISYNSEGFISFDEMKSMLEEYGKVKTVEIKYNAFRGSRNLNARSIHVSEYLFILKKN